MTQHGESTSSDSSPEEPKQKEEKGVKIRFSLFFDGTLNNRTNTQSRLEANENYQKHKAKNLDNSYENDQSNIAKMERYIDDTEEFDHSIHAYIEGAGTIDNQGDSIRGAALGTGATGVKSKVNQGLVDAVLQLKEEVKGGTRIDELVIDAFGFSRGAAGARFFVHKALSETPVSRGKNQIPARPIARRLRAQGYKIENKNVKVRFVGLYDTVASEGINHRNDTWSLKMDSIGRPDVETVIQLASADEHRANFSLTNIESAGAKGKEIFLPGVHSDIGGGYRDDASEALTLNRSVSKSMLEDDRKLLIDRGWYQEQEIWIESPPDISPLMTGPHGSGPPVQYHKLKARRDKISNEYSKVPLHLMAEFARRSEINLFSELEDVENIGSNLTSVLGDLKAYADGSSSKADDWIHNNKYGWLTDVCNKYFHFSAHYKTSAGIFAPHKPNLVKGKRVRKIHYG
jgi:hypothetical protein